MYENVAYLIQGKRENLRKLADVLGQWAYYLCYDVDQPINAGQAFIFDNECTWAEGRNRLLDLALQNGRHEYFVFCDDDCVLVRGTFDSFSRRLLETRPAIAVPVMPKAKLFGPLHAGRVQGAVVIDEQMVAIHRSVVGTVGVAPLVTDYDPISWYAACLIFEHQAFAKFDRAVQQFNDIEIENAAHTWKEPNTKYRQGEWRQYWPLVRSWIGRHGRYDWRILEPYYPVFRTDPIRTDMLKREALNRHRKARAPVANDGQSVRSRRA